MGHHSLRLDRQRFGVNGLFLGFCAEFSSFFLFLPGFLQDLFCYFCFFWSGLVSAPGNRAQKPIQTKKNQKEPKNPGEIPAKSGKFPGKSAQNPGKRPLTPKRCLSTGARPAPVTPPLRAGLLCFVVLWCSFCILGSLSV